MPETKKGTFAGRLEWRSDPGDLTYEYYYHSMFVNTLGRHTLEYYAVNNYGTAEEHKSVEFTVVAPDVPVLRFNMGNTLYQPGKVTWQAADYGFDISVTDGVSSWSCSGMTLDDPANPVDRILTLPGGTGPFEVELTIYTPNAGAQTYTREGVQVGSGEVLDLSGEFSEPGHDVEAPVTTSDVAESYVGTATIRLTPVDALGYFDGTYYTVDGEFGSGELIEIAAPASGSEVHTITFWSEDLDGNGETRNSATFTVSAVE